VPVVAEEHRVASAQAGVASPSHAGGEAAQGAEGNRRASAVGHSRRGSVVPVNVDRQALNYQRRRSVDVPVLPQGSLPKLGPGVPLTDDQVSPSAISISKQSLGPPRCLPACLGLPPRGG
jgi:hypothetical protein